MIPKIEYFYEKQWGSVMSTCNAYHVREDSVSGVIASPPWGAKQSLCHFVIK